MEPDTKILASLLEALGARDLWVYDGKLEASPGSEVTHTCQELISLAAIYGEPLTIDFNGVSITAKLGDNPDELVDVWRAEIDHRYQEYLASPEYAEMQAKLAADREVTAARAIAAVEGQPTPDWDAIKSNWMEHAKKLGMSRWGTDDVPLMLFPKTWLGFVLRSKGLEVESINGDKLIVGRDYVDDDDRYGYLAYGLRVRGNYV